MNASPRSCLRTPASRWFLAAVGLLVVGRIVVAAYTPIIDDEGYYWIWSRHLSLSYLDHPPLVAWVGALATAATRTEWLLRMPAMLASLATTAMLYGFGRDLFGEPAGLRAAALHVAIPVFALQSLHAIPDPLLYAWWTAGLWTFWRAVHGDGRMWWACGVTLGLGILSKYPMIVLLATWLAVLAWRRDGRTWRASNLVPAGLLALALAAPVIIWNVQHDWASFRFWFHAGGSGGPPAGGRRGWELLGDVAVQFGYAGPLVFPVMLWALWRSWRQGRGDERFAYLALAGIPTFLAVVAANLLGVNRPNWPAPAYLAGVLAVGALWPPRIGAAAFVSSLVLSVAAAVMILAMPWLPPSIRWDELYGWREVTSEMVRRADALGDPGHVLLLGQRYNEASYFGYYTRERVPVTTGRLSEFSVLAPPHRFIGWQAIAAIDAREPVRALPRDCERLTEQPSYTVPFPGGGGRTFRVFHCVGFRGTPPVP